jgi:TrkA-N domain/RyR domain
VTTPPPFRQVAPDDPLPLKPGPPVGGLWWLRSRRLSPHKLPAPLLVAAVIALILVLGSWGFDSLALRPHLGIPTSIYRATKLLTLDMGPAAGGSGAPRATWQLWVGVLLAAALLARGVLAIWRNSLRRLATRRVLRRHVIVCGGGIHGSRLVEELAKDHDVVLVDKDPNAPRMRSAPQRNEWRLTGDCVEKETLIRAGVKRAHWVVAMLGHDYVASQVASTVRALGRDDNQILDRVHVLVQVEDPSLARFLEQKEEYDDAVDREKMQRSPIISPFSPNAIAAETLLADDWSAGDPLEENPLREVMTREAPNLLLAGDHPILGALILELVRKWRVRILRDLESAKPHKSPPVHVSVIGPAAVARTDTLLRQWHPEPDVVWIEARDVDLDAESLSGAEEWLQRPDRADHTIVACQEELDGIRLTLQLSRTLPEGVCMTRLAAQPTSDLDEQIQDRTKRRPELATTQVKSLAELASDPSRLERAHGPERLVSALKQSGCDEQRATDLSADLYDKASALDLRSDSGWRIRACERPILEALLAPVPPSAIVRAGLRVDVASAANLSEAAARLSAQDSPAAFAAWCEYARHEVDHKALAKQPVPDGAIDNLLRLRLSTLGETVDLSSFQPGPIIAEDVDAVAIFVGPSEMSTRVSSEAETLLLAALRGYGGVILASGSGSGISHVVASTARARGLSGQLFGYARANCGNPELFSMLRTVPDSPRSPAEEQLAMWTDVLSASIPVHKVRVVAFAGGQDTVDQILLARALGARVAYVDPTGESLNALDDLLPLGLGDVLELPTDPMTVHAFLQTSHLPDVELREAVACHIHNDYRRRVRGHRPPTDPALAPWNDLLPSLQVSNRAQADDIPNKLALIGKRVVPHGASLELTQEELALLAEAEHGRWNVERLSAGWRPGERDLRRGISPSLKPWHELDERTKSYDIDAVVNIGPALAEAGWGVADITN